MRNLMMCVALAALATACGPGNLRPIEVTMPRGEQATIVAHDQIAPDWMLSGRKIALNFIVRGKVTNEQLEAVAEAERACRIYTKVVRPSKAVSIGISTGLYAATTAAGLALGVQAFSGAVATVEYLGYGAGAGGGGGLANGFFTLGGQTYTFEECGRELMDMFGHYGVRVIMKAPY